MHSECSLRPAVSLRTLLGALLVRSRCGVERLIWEREGEEWGEELLERVPRGGDCGDMMVYLGYPTIDSDPINRTYDMTGHGYLKHFSQTGLQQYNSLQST
eukprot:gene1356-biopygen4268